MDIKLFADDGITPLYQPFQADYGIKYHTHTFPYYKHSGWKKEGENGFLSTTDVAVRTNVDINLIRKWEKATDTIEELAEDADGFE